MAAKPSKSILFLPDEETVELREKTTVLALALKHKIDLDHSCGGMGSCGTCRIIVESDLSQLPRRTLLEQEIAADRDFEPRERLACQLIAQDGYVIRIPGRE